MYSSVPKRADTVGELPLGPWMRTVEAHGFTSLEQAREQIEAWHQDYNEQRPHSSLDNQSPAEFLANWQQQQSQKKAPD